MQHHRTGPGAPGSALPARGDSIRCPWNTLRDPTPTSNLSSNAAGLAALANSFGQNWLFRQLRAAERLPDDMETSGKHQSDGNSTRAAIHEVTATRSLDGPSRPTETIGFGPFFIRKPALSFHPPCVFMRLVKMWSEPLRHTTFLPHRHTTFLPVQPGRAAGQSPYLLPKSLPLRRRGL